LVALTKAPVPPRNRTPLVEYVTSLFIDCAVLFMKENSVRIYMSHMKAVASKLANHELDLVAVEEVI